MSPGTFERVIQVPDVGELLVKIYRTSIYQIDGSSSWIGTISCRNCDSKPFKEVLYVVEKEFKHVKEQLANLLKNLYLGDHHNGNIFQEDQ